MLRFAKQPHRRVSHINRSYGHAAASATARTGRATALPLFDVAIARPGREREGVVIMLFPIIFSLKLQPCFVWFRNARYLCSRRGCSVLASAAEGFLHHKTRAQQQLLPRSICTCQRCTEESETDPECQQRGILRSPWKAASLGVEICQLSFTFKLPYSLMMAQC